MRRADSVAISFSETIETLKHHNLRQPDIIFIGHGYLVLTCQTPEATPTIFALQESWLPKFPKIAPFL